MSKPNQRKQNKQKARIKRIAKARKIAKSKRTTLGLKRPSCGKRSATSLGNFERVSIRNKLRAYDRKQLELEIICSDTYCRDAGVNTTSCKFCDYKLEHCSYHSYSVRAKVSAHLDKNHPEVVAKWEKG